MTHVYSISSTSMCFLMLHKTPSVMIHFIAISTLHWHLDNMVNIAKLWFGLPLGKNVVFLDEHSSRIFYQVEYDIFHLNENSSIDSDHSIEWFCWHWPRGERERESDVGSVITGEGGGGCHGGGGDSLTPVPRSNNQVLNPFSDIANWLIIYGYSHSNFGAVFVCCCMTCILSDPCCVKRALQWGHS